jgi:hypothetical protein
LPPGQPQQLPPAIPQQRSQREILISQINRVFSQMQEINEEERRTLIRLQHAEMGARLPRQLPGQPQMLQDLANELREVLAALNRADRINQQEMRRLLNQLNSLGNQ